MTSENEKIPESVEAEAAVTDLTVTEKGDDNSPEIAETKDAAESEPDYSELLDSDMRELSAEFQPDGKIKITDLKNPVRYGALRDLGLTPKEAYLASGGRRERADNRAHLSSSVPRAMTSAFSEIPRSELEVARELFGDMSDSEIRNLYKKVTQ